MPPLDRACPKRAVSVEAPRNDGRTRASSRPSLSCPSWETDLLRRRDGVLGEARVYLGKTEGRKTTGRASVGDDGSARDIWRYEEETAPLTAPHPALSPEVRGRI